MTHQSRISVERSISVESEMLYTLHSHAMENDYSFALWRLPQSVEKNFILSFSTTVLSNDETLEDLGEGFLFGSFDKRKHPTFLKADFSFTFKDGQLSEPVNPLQTSSQEWLREIQSKPLSNSKTNFYNKQYKTEFKAGAEDFKKIINKSIQGIESGEFEKVVPSRKKEIALPESFDAIEAFQKLCYTYPNAMVSLVGIPSVGTWLGASPELLVSVENKSIFRTVSLAGTKSYEEGMNLKQVAWTQKEIEEQALVSRYIINNFKKIRLREFEEHGPKTVVAGNLMHLKTEFTVDMKATNFPQLGSVMLQLLHPTSAVCGMPLEPSIKFLQQHEGYDREFYSGYLGPVNMSSCINIYVNLRCMQILENKAVIYAGAGVTIDSDPQTEWKETEMKLNTLLKVIL